MRPVSHVVISVGTAAFIYSWFSSLWAALICFLSGILFDIDHIPEYLFFRKGKIGLKDFYYSNLANEKERIYVILHSFELIIFLWTVISVFRLNLFWIVITLSFSVHLIFDSFFNPVVTIYTYFLSYRIVKGFRAHHLFKSY
ncbi:MAG: hypothetical protein AB1629_07815 [Candidatus Omnitrophota bacterium]